jgi:hypothetical protein
VEKISFFLPGKENYYAQETGYAFIKALTEEFTGQEVYSTRIFRLLYRLGDLLVAAQVGELCPVNKKQVVAIFETCCTFVVVSMDHIYYPLVIRKDAVVSQEDFQAESWYLQAS